MSVRAWTSAIIVTVVAALIGWDIYAALSGQPGATISEVLRDAAVARPIIAFAAGVLVGHFWWPQEASRRQAGK